jgi:predicted lipoprotein with Yx(FWY)xxD motif
MKHIAPAFLSLAMLTGCTTFAVAASPASVANGVLVGPNQMTLYTFDPDMAGSGKSVCNGPCATNWPPLMAAEGAKPTGDTTGDGVNNAWRVVKP